jgi:hypothetical protein
MRRFETVIGVFLIAGILLVVGVGASAAKATHVDGGTNPVAQAATQDVLATQDIPTDVPAPSGSPIPPTHSPVSAGAAGGKIRPPLTLDALTAQYPDLKDYLNKIKDIKVGDMDFSEFYAKIAQIYTSQGAAGVATFLQDSGLLTKLGIPLSYLDLIELADKGGMDAVLTEARKRKIVTDKDELDGYLVVDSPDNVDAVMTSIKSFGITAYDYNPDTGEIQIGIPLDLIRQFGTPNALIKFFVQVGTMPHVTGLRGPIPISETTKKL